MSDEIKITYKGGVFGVYEYEAKYKDMTETLQASVPPEDTGLLMAIFDAMFKARERENER